MLAGYEASYFIPTARRVLEPLLLSQGFQFAGDHRAVTVYWTRDQRFLRIGYLPETKPQYELLVGLGESNAPLNPKATQNSIGAWRLVPPAIAPRLVDWRFTSERSLRDVLRRAWTEVIEPYVLPVLDEPEGLAELIGGHADELTDADQQLVRERILRWARTEFDAGRFADAVSAYTQLGEAQLTRADRKRLEIARRRM